MSYLNFYSIVCVDDIVFHWKTCELAYTLIILTYLKMGEFFSFSENDSTRNNYSFDTKIFLYFCVVWS